MFSVCIMLLLVILLVPILVVTCGNSQKDKKKKDKDIGSKKKKTKKKVRKMASGDITTDANSNVHSAINGQASSLHSSNQKQSALMVDHSKRADGSSIEASTRPPSSLDDYYHSRQTTKVRSVSAYFKKGTTSKKNPGDGAGHTQTPPQKKDDKKTKIPKPDDDKKDKDYRDKN